MGWRRAGHARVPRTLGAVPGRDAAGGRDPGPAAASVGGGCTVTGTSTSRGTIDLTATAVWYVLSTDQVSAVGNAPFAQFHGSASAYALGFALPLASGDRTGGDTPFQWDA